MAIFDFFKKTKEKERFLKKQKEKKAKDKEASVDNGEKEIKKETRKNKEKDIYSKETEPKSETLVLESPYITEKSGDLREQNGYVFKVFKEANKIMIKRAVEILYKTKVEKVNIARKPSKQIFVKGKKGRKQGFKKAIVFLKKGEKIEI